MPPEQPDDPARLDPPQAEVVLGDLGLAMLAAGYAVTDVTAALKATGAAHGCPEMRFAVFPHAVLIDGPGAERPHMAYQEPSESMTFDQTARVGQVASEAAAGSASLRAISQSLAGIRAMPDRYGAAGTIVGNALLSAGVSAVFRTSPSAVAADFVLGLLVGVVLIGAARNERLAALLPFVLGVIVAALVYGVGPHVGVPDAPLYTVISPIVLLVPGAVITTAVIELTDGNTVAGGGRLVNGMIILFCMVFGIVVGAAIAGVTLAELGVVPIATLPQWPGWIGVVVLGIGVGLMLSASLRLMAIMCAVLLLTYAVVVLVESRTDSIIASGVGAATLLPLTRLLEEHQPDLPSVVTFRPAFWLLVPGSLGLATFTNIITSEASDARMIATFTGTFLAIAIGVQVGAAIAQLVSRPFPHVHRSRSRPQG